MTDQPRVLELRVHGVSGTPPHNMLGVESENDVRLVIGDETTGFYRAMDPASTSGPPLPPGAEREAYSWGALTSSAGGLLGGIRRAGWLTLLPFALVNVAMWARPGLSRPSAGQFVSAAIVRTAGLLLTALLIVTACGVGIDLITWQCFRVGVPSCPSLPGFLDFLAADTFRDPGRRLLVGQLLPLAVLGLFWWLSATTMRRYEEYPPTGTSPGDGPELPTIGTEVPVLARHEMWDGAHRTLALRRLHLALGVAVTVWFTARPMSDPPGWDLFDAVWIAAAVLVVAVLVLTCAGVRDQPEYGTASQRLRDDLDAFSSAVFCLSVVLLAAHSVLLWFAGAAEASLPTDLPDAGALPGILVVALFAMAAALVGVGRAPWTPVLLCLPVAGVLAALWLVQGSQRPWAVAGVLVALALGAAIWHRKEALPHAAWDGAAPAVLIGLAALVAVLFSTGITLVVADRLNGGPRVTALATQFTTEPTPHDLRLASNPVVEKGWLELTETGATLRNGLVRTAALTPDELGEDLTSRPVTGGMLHVPGSILLLRDTCVTSEDGTPVRLKDSSVLLPPSDRAGSAIAQIEVTPTTQAPPGVPAGCGAVTPGTVRIVATTTPTVLTVPAPYMWFATALPLLLLLTAVLLWLVLRRVRKTHDAIDELADTELAEFPKEARDQGRRARRRAAIPHRAEAIVSVLAIPAIIAAIGITVGVIVGGTPWEAVPDLAVPARALGNIGLFVAVGIALGLLAIGARLRSSAPLRRAVGVIWDISTFWPRAAHPFGPPCYGERVVPQITERTRAVLDNGGRVVLSGHSQGSTVLVAVLWQLCTDPQFPHVRFVSYGSQLRTWFGRIFPDPIGPHVQGHEPTERPRLGLSLPDAPLVDGPAYMPPPGTLAHRLCVADEDPNWQSLFRRTDPIGFRVHQGTDGLNPVDRYVCEVLPVTGVTTKSLVGTHSNYPATPEYDDVVAPWLVPPGVAGGPLT